MARKPKQAAPKGATKAAPPGAVARDVELKEIQPVQTGTLVNIITTGRGTFDGGGVVPVGTKATIAVKMFSRAWMKPADQKSLELIRKELAARAKG